MGALYRRIKEKRIPDVGFCGSYSFQDGYVQARPYPIVTDYIGIHNNATYRETGGGGWSFDARGVSPFYDDKGAVANATNNARERFKEQISNSAALGIDIAEYSQSLNMIATRGAQLFKFANSLRKGNFGAAAKALGFDKSGKAFKKPDGVKISRSFANNFLEWHFGWSPLLQDIHDASQAISNPIKSVKPRARARDGYGRFDSTGSGGDMTLDIANTIVIVCCGAKVTVSNPALHLAESLGVINPVQIAWETVPFSFVVDWFLPVSNFLGQLSDFAGLDIASPWSTVVYHTSQLNFRSNSAVPSTSTTNGFGTYVKRVPGIPSVQLKAKPLGLPSSSRAATAVSLATQALTKGR